MAAVGPHVRPCARSAWSVVTVGGTLELDNLVIEKFGTDGDLGGCERGARWPRRGRRPRRSRWRRRCRRRTGGCRLRRAGTWQRHPHRHRRTGEAHPRGAPAERRRRRRWRRRRWWALLRERRERRRRRQWWGRRHGGRRRRCVGRCDLQRRSALGRRDRRLREQPGDRRSEWRCRLSPRRGSLPRIRHGRMHGRHRGRGRRTGRRRDQRRGRAPRCATDDQRCRRRTVELARPVIDRLPAARGPVGPAPPSHAARRPAS